MINLTANAAAKVKGILEQEKENIPQGGLRIYVQGGGCSGFRTAWSSTRRPTATRSSRRRASRSSSTP